MPILTDKETSLEFLKRILLRHGSPFSVGPTMGLSDRESFSLRNGLPSAFEANFCLITL